jgi:hypothetical protein
MAKMPPTSVYLIAAPEVRRVKIGVSSNASLRLSNLQGASAAMLRLDDSFEASCAVQAYKIEARLHAELMAYHSHNEWFTDCPEVRAAFEKEKAVEWLRLVSTCVRLSSEAEEQNLTEIWE